MRIPIRVTSDSPEPMYHQIEVQLRALILNGELPEGTLLPSIREFAQEVNCSVITIRRVYQDLENEGLLRTRQGTGTFVASVTSDKRRAFRAETVLEALRSAAEAAKRVRLTREETEKLFSEVMDEVFAENKSGEEGGGSYE